MAYAPLDVDQRTSALKKLRKSDWKVSKQLRKLFESSTGYEFMGWDRHDSQNPQLYIVPSSSFGEEPTMFSFRNLETMFGLSGEDAFVLRRLIEAEMSLADALAILGRDS